MSEILWKKIEIIDKKEVSLPWQQQKKAWRLPSEIRVQSMSIKLRRRGQYIANTYHILQSLKILFWFWWRNHRILIQSVGYLFCAHQRLLWQHHIGDKINKFSVWILPRTNLWGIKYSKSRHPLLCGCIQTVDMPLRFANDLNCKSAVLSERFTAKLVFSF